MCLCIAVWDKHHGTMVSEGRMVSVTPVAVGGNGSVSGTFMRTMSDEYFKVHRLSAELILGAVGDCHILDELRAGIAANVGTFAQMRDEVIPRYVAVAKRKHPDGCFQILLMGVDGGQVRCAQWSAKDPNPTVPAIPAASACALAIGVNNDCAGRALRAAYRALILKNKTLPAERETHAALARVFDDLAKDYPAELNRNLRFEGVHVPALTEQTTDCKLIGGGETNLNLFEAPGDTEAVVFEAPNRLNNFAGGEIWIGATGVSDRWGGCNILVSQDGTTYKAIGTIDASARLGFLDSTFASGSDPDTTNSLVLDMLENSPPLDAGTSADADQGNTLCYVDGELISYSAVAVTGQNQVTMDTYIRRGQFGSLIGSHAPGSQFLRLDDTIFKFIYDPLWAGQTIFFKFQSFNIFDNSPQDPSTLTPLSFTIPGQGATNPPSSTTDVWNGDFEISSELPPFGWQIIPTIAFMRPRPGFVSPATLGTNLMTYDTSSQYQGARSLLLACKEAQSSELRTIQKYIVTPGENFKLQAAMKMPSSGSSGTGATGSVSLIFYDASGSVTGSVSVSVTPSNTSWILQSASGAVPAGSTYAYVVVLADATAATGGGSAVEFDSISLVRVPDLSADVTGTLPIASVGARTGSITFVIDGGGSVVTTGVKGQVSIPNNCTITGWVITADQSGSAVVDVLKSSYSGFPTTSSIAGSDFPTLSSAQKNDDTTLSAWGTTAISAGDIVQFSVTSCTSCERLMVTLNVEISG